jgi:hypothetical protein
LRGTPRLKHNHSEVAVVLRFYVKMGYIQFDRKIHESEEISGFINDWNGCNGNAT